MTNSRLIVLASVTLATVGIAANLATSATARNLFADKGTLKGKMTNSKGAPAVGCPIKIFAPINNEGGGRKSAGFDTEQPTMLQGKNTVLAAANADAQGNFEIKMPIEAGSYRYIAGNRAFGLAGGTVTIEAGKPTVLEITLNAPAPR